MSSGSSFRLFIALRCVANEMQHILYLLRVLSGVHLPEYVCFMISCCSSSFFKTLDASQGFFIKSKLRRRVRHVIPVSEIQEEYFEGDPKLSLTRVIT